ncbi:MAG: gfo/Idh/MocA family oxidoreductase [Spirochaetaceae bacterium]|nr:MAG: gfo/Idh/MocA family oxidoreductase [Spirochaetaceae bacterium]
MRFGIIGCGRIAPEHLRAIAEHDSASLIACADIDDEKAQSVSRQTGCTAYTDYRKMLAAHPEIEVVSILTPSGLHPEQAIDVMEHFGRHVIVEKPMALDPADADRMIASAQRSGVKLFVVKQNRYNRPVVRLREAMEAGRFGRILMGTVRVRWMRDQAYYDLADWRGTKRLDGGVLSNQAIHHLDLLLWMLGEPVSVFARTERYLVDIEAEDTAVAIVKFASGATGVIEATTACRPDDLEGSLSILGERGTVEISGIAVNELKHWRFTDSEPDEEAQLMASLGEAPKNVYGFGHGRYLDAVIQSLTSDKPGPVDGTEGRRSIELLHAIYASAEKGTEVLI